MIGYGSTLPPFVRKAMPYLAAKDPTAEPFPTRMGGGARERVEAGAFGKMPASRDPRADQGRDVVGSASTATIADLEAKCREPATIPADLANRARVIRFEQIADSMVAAEWVMAAMA